MGRLKESFPQGKTVIIYVDPNRTAKSYLPSGLGWTEPLLIGIAGLGLVALFVWHILAPVSHP